MFIIVYHDSVYQNLVEYNNINKLAFYTCLLL